MLTKRVYEYFFPTKQVLISCAFRICWVAIIIIIIIILCLMEIETWLKPHACTATTVAIKNNKLKPQRNDASI